MSSVFYLCESGEVKKRANAYRRTYIRLKGVLFDVVKSVGSDKSYIDDTMMLISGVKFDGPVPAGWSKPHRRTKDCRPLRTKENAELLKHFTPFGCYCVKAHPELQKFWDWLECPDSYRWKSADGKSSGSRGIGDFFRNLQMYWYAERGPLLLKTPDVAAAKEEAEKEKRIVEGNVLNWQPPKGLRRILPQKWDLMQAEHAARKGEKDGDSDD